jgi:hypothetical protein
MAGLPVSRGHRDGTYSPLATTDKDDGPSASGAAAGKPAASGPVTELLRTSRYVRTLGLCLLWLLASTTIILVNKYIMVGRHTPARPSRPTAYAAQASSGMAAAY